MSDKIGLLGTGLLRDAIAETLGPRAATTNLEGGDGPLAMLVAASDAWDTSPHASARTRATNDQVAWLPVWTEQGYVLLGPLEAPGQTGCVDCAATRRRRVNPHYAERAAVWQRYGDQLAATPSSWLTGLAGQLVADLVTAEVRRVTSDEAPLTSQTLCRLDLESLALTRHRFLADPECAVCGGLPTDAPEQAHITLHSQPAYKPGSYRRREVSLPQIMDYYVDSESGLVRQLYDSRAGALLVSVAPLGGRGEAASVVGYGRAATFDESRLTALLELLERYGSSPRARQGAVSACYHEVRTHAVNPYSLGLHAPDQYAVPEFSLQPFDPDRTYPWVWGWSFARREPLLVPESYAYYGVHRHSQTNRPFVYEVSNGCALGSCLEEAILYGLLEVAERDAFLLTWYARLPAPRLDLTTANSKIVRLLAASIEAETGYQVTAFDISTEQEIPCIWAMAANPAEDGRPAIACAAAAHPDPELATRNALRELGPSLAVLINRYEDPAAVQRARDMTADSAEVKEMDDHMLLYANPSAATRLDFLTQGDSVRSLAEVGAADRGGFTSDDLRDNLREAIGRYTRHGLDVIVVDQTASEHRAGGLSCVKVLVPGTLPMTFGHHFRRIDGLPRLNDVPQLLGYRDGPMPPEEINTYPHPFP